MTSNEQVIKSVAKKLKYYIDVRRLEDGFDLSGANQPILDHPPLKARPTLQYSGLHDRSLKHYFSSNDVRVSLTQMRNRPISAAPHETNVKHRLRKYMSNYQFQLTGPDLPPVPEGERRPKSRRKSKKSQNELPEYFYIYSASARSLRPEATGFGVPLKSPKKKPIKGGWPVLRTVPSKSVSRGEAERLVNAATKLLVATESVEQNGHPASNRQQTAPRPFEESLLDRYLTSQSQTSVEGFPGLLQAIDEEEALLLYKSRQPSKTGGKRPSTAKYTYDINGRRVKQEDMKSYDDSFIGRCTRSARRPYSSHPSSRPTSKRVYRHRSPTPSDSVSVSNQSSLTQTTSTSEQNMERLPPSSHSKKSSRRQFLSADSEKSDRPNSSKYRTRTIINVPELKVNEDVSVQDTTQTNAAQDEIGIQTETRLIKEYDQQEDEVKQGPWSEYQIYIRTGTNIGSSTKADVKLILYGELGRTKEIMLGASKTNKVAFQKGKEDLFMIAAHHVGKLKKIKIGHDRTELSNAWFLDSVSISDMHGKRIYEFPCRQWLSEHDGDKRTYRVLPADRDRAFVDALESPRASQTKPSARHETSEDDSAPVVVKHDKASVKVHQSKSGGKNKRKTKSDSEYTTSDFESSSDENEAAVVSVKEKTDSGSKGSKVKPKPKSKQPTKSESRTRSGPTFTFRSKDPKKSATRRETEDTSEHERLERKKTQEEFLEGYKAGITAASTESQKRSDEEKEKERRLLQGETVHDASRWGHLDRLKELLEHFPEMKNQKDESGWTPLHHASSNGEIDVVKWLTTSNVDLNVETPTGYTPIHVAAMNGHVNAMIILSAMGAAVTCRTVDQQTPLHLAARGGFLECVKWLVANRARIDTEDNFKRTPIDMAEEYQQSSVVDFLRVCQRELKNPQSSFSQMHATQGGQTSSKDADGNYWKDDKASNVSQSAEAGSDDVSIKVSPSQEVQEKRRIYEKQHHKMEESGMSFLDSIRQEAES